MTRHKRVVAQYLSEHYQPFFEAYNKLLRSSNYVTRRQSLKVCAAHTPCPDTVLAQTHMHNLCQHTHAHMFM